MRSSTPPGLRAEREARGRRLDEVVRRRVGRDRDLDRVAAVGGGDRRSSTPSRASIETVKAVPSGDLVLVGHRPQPELVGARLGQAEADQPAAVGRHEVDRLGRRELRGDHEVALVLAVGVVDDDDEAALADVLDRVLDGGERCRHCHAPKASAVLAARAGARRTSRARPASRFTGSPGASSPSVVAASVCGTSATAKPAVVERGDGEARAVDGDRALLDHVAEDLVGRVDPDAPCRRPPASTRRTRADAVDVPLDVVPAERLAGPQRGLDVDASTRREAARATCARASRARRRSRCARPRSSTAVRQTPPIETESPTARRRAVAGASTSSRSAVSAPRRRSRRRPADLANDPREHRPRLAPAFGLEPSPQPVPPTDRPQASARRLQVRGETRRSEPRPLGEMPPTTDATAKARSCAHDSVPTCVTSAETAVRRARGTSSPALLAVGERLDRLAHDHLELAALAGEGVAERRRAAPRPRRAGPGRAPRCRSPRSACAARRCRAPHQPVREQGDDLVVGALELTVRGHGPHGSWT